MKKYVAIGIVCIWICGNVGATPRFREAGILDKITLKHWDNNTPQTGNALGIVYLYTQENSTAKMDRIDALRMTGSLWSLSADSIAAPLFVDCRPYSGYYVDFPLAIAIRAAGKQTITYEKTASNEASLDVATAIELRSTADSNVRVDFLTKNSYDFDAYAFDAKKVNDTIKVLFLRVWGANRVKENVQNAQWNDPNSWLGVAPKPEIKNLYILIPEAATIAIPSGSIEVDTVNNEGTLTNGGTLTAERVFNTGTITNNKGSTIVVTKALYLGSNSSESQ
ncbi:MAG: hypothetical protein FWF52_10190 [Candidatus Azobacteroides sp.]|nr:hypothetical protein [Candidatus Azobacteroides sp.]